MSINSYCLTDIATAGTQFLAPNEQPMRYETAVHIPTLLTGLPEALCGYVLMPRSAWES